MKQLEMFAPISKSVPGAKWWAGNWECRNKDGYFQDREGGVGPWSYVIYGFGEEDCSIYRISEEGHLIFECVPIDTKNRITVNGRKFGPSNWRH